MTDGEIVIILEEKVKYFMSDISEYCDEELINSLKEAIKRIKENSHLKTEIAQLKVKVKRYIPFEFDQKIYSIEQWDDTGDFSIYEYTFDGVEKDGLRFIYQGNKEDVCVFSIDDIGVNIFEHKEDAQNRVNQLIREQSDGYQNRK